MHIRNFPFFLRANKIGAPYGDADTSILLVASRSSIYFFNSSSSVWSNGYNLRLGGGLFSSYNLISCWNILSNLSVRYTGYVGSLNTSGNVCCNVFNVSSAYYLY